MREGGARGFDMDDNGLRLRREYVLPETISGFFGHRFAAGATRPEGGEGAGAAKARGWSG